MFLVYFMSGMSLFLSILAFIESAAERRISRDLLNDYVMYRKFYMHFDKECGGNKK